MACGITAIDQSAVSCQVDGGVVAAYATECANITSITYDATGVISAFTMGSVGLWEKFVFDDDDSAFYNQEPERAGRKLNYNQSGFMKFAGITNPKIDSARTISQCCCTVWIWELSSGPLLVQGIDVDIDDTAAFRFTKQKARVTPGVFSDTGDNEERVEFTVDSVGRTLSATTSLSTTAIEAL